jgi:hypothetical protein
MKRKINICFLLFFLLLGQSCKKKTSVQVLMWNYALGEPSAGANVVLVEKHTGFGGKTSCEEIASATSDQEGRCVFDREKLRKSKGYDYFVNTNFIYGKDASYPCSIGRTHDGYIEKGGTQEIVLNVSDYEAHLQVQYNNLLNPSQPNDSLLVSISLVAYTVPGEPYPFGGGGIVSSSTTQNSFGYPFPPTFISGSIQTYGSKHLVQIRKRKLGVVTTSLDTIKVYPYQTATVVVNW